MAATIENPIMPDYRHPPIEITGSEPVGLAAALTITTASRDARIYERRSEVSSCLLRGFQGIENLTGEMDVLDKISALGIATDFEHIRSLCRCGTRSNPIITLLM